MWQGGTDLWKKKECEGQEAESDSVLHSNCTDAEDRGAQKKSKRILVIRGEGG